MQRFDNNFWPMHHLSNIQLHWWEFIATLHLTQDSLYGMNTYWFFFHLKFYDITLILSYESFLQS